MTVTTRWWWIRHAPVVNPEGRIYGQLDMAADLSDRNQFERLANILPSNPVWVTTTLQRAKKTAQKLVAGAGPEQTIAEEDTLREQAFGDWEGVHWKDIPSEESETYWQDPAHNRMPNGESFADVVRRVTATVERLTADHSGRDIVAVAHAGSIRAAISHALGGEARPALSFHVSPLSLTRLDAIHRDGRIWWRISGVNIHGNHT